MSVKYKYVIYRQCSQILSRLSYYFALSSGKEYIFGIKLFFESGIFIETVTEYSFTAYKLRHELNK